VRWIAYVLAQLRRRKDAIPPAARGHMGAPMTYWDRHGAAYGAGVYAQSVAALRSLGAPAKVDCALRAYVARNAYGIAEPSDLLAALLALSLGGFLWTWLFVAVPLLTNERVVGAVRAVRGDARVFSDTRKAWLLLGGAAIALVALSGILLVTSLTPIGG